MLADLLRDGRNNLGLSLAVFTNCQAPWPSLVESSPLLKCGDASLHLTKKLREIHPRTALCKGAQIIMTMNLSSLAYCRKRTKIGKYLPLLFGF